jgi:hypothetical protein
MRITEDVCRYAAEKRKSEGAALEEDLKQKATAFTNTGSKIYAKAHCVMPAMSAEKFWGADALPCSGVISDSEDGCTFVMIPHGT